MTPNAWTYAAFALLFALVSPPSALAEAPAGQTPQNQGAQGQNVQGQNAQVPNAQAQPAKSKSQANVLDFEGDVIEGQKKTPEIFLQTEVERPTLDTVLYQRRHFNDFHKSDSRQRPRASDPPR